MVGVVELSRAAATLLAPLALPAVSSFHLLLIRARNIPFPHFHQPLVLTKFCWLLYPLPPIAFG